MVTSNTIPWKYLNRRSANLLRVHDSNHVRQCMPRSCSYKHARDTQILSHLDYTRTRTLSSERMATSSSLISKASETAEAIVITAK